MATVIVPLEKDNKRLRVINRSWKANGESQRASLVAQRLSSPAVGQQRKLKNKVGFNYQSI